MDPVRMFVVNEVEEEEQAEIVRLERRRLRDNANPFDLPEPTFIKNFRLNKDLAINLIEEITPFMDAGINKIINCSKKCKFNKTQQEFKGTKQPFPIEYWQHSVFLHRDRINEVLEMKLKLQWHNKQQAKP